MTTPLILDGALGTSLIRAGMPAGSCPEEWILESAEHENVVRDLVRSYVRAGSRAVYTPTFGANASVLSSHGLSHRAAEFSSRLARLVRETVSEFGFPVSVFGDLSPTGRFLAPMGDATFDELVAVYKEQISAMAPYADAFISETNLQLADARAALFAAKSVCPEKDFFATFTLSSDFVTLGGTDVRSAAVILFSLGARGVGLNCSMGPAAMQTAIGALSLLRPEQGCILAKPNAGLPDEHGNFSLSPEAFAAEAKPLFSLGADLLGGCCGTSPEYVRALSSALEGERAERASAAISDLLASERGVFELPASFPEPLPADENLMAKLDFSAESLHLYFETPASADQAAEVFCYLVNTPLLFSAATSEAMERALFLYQGRAAADLSGFSEKEKEHILTTYSPVQWKG